MPRSNSANTAAMCSIALRGGGIHLFLVGGHGDGSRVSAAPRSVNTRLGFDTSIRELEDVLGDERAVAVL
jgi:hypothetical protein